MGDFNSRTGVLPDTVTNDNSNNLPLPEGYVEDTPLARNNCDTQVNAFGKEPISLWISARIRILNDRFLGDSL